MGLLDFEGQIAFYGQYHNNTINKIIHVINIPAIVFTILVWTSGVQVPYLSALLAPYLSFKVSHFLMLFYSFYYILLEPIAGLLYAPILATMVIGAELFVLSFPEDYLKYSLIIHVTSWVSQFIGHGIFEKRRPALMDNLAQAFLLAPFFVFMEVLFALGYRPLLHRRIQSKVDKAIEEWKKSKKSN